MANKNNLTGVFLGRFAPFHKGHMKVLDYVIQKNGESNTLVLIGSTNVINDRTPYTYKFRKKLIQHLYPGIRILPFADTGRTRISIKRSNSLWLKRLKNFEKKLKTTFIFYGGSKKDLNILKRKFSVEVPIHRNKKGNKISGTKIRNFIKKGHKGILYKYLDKKIINKLNVG